MLAAGSDFSISLAWIMPNTGIHAGLRAVGQHWFQRAAKRIPCRCMESGRAVQFEILLSFIWIIKLNVDRVHFFSRRVSVHRYFFLFLSSLLNCRSPPGFNTAVVEQRDITCVANHLQAPPIKGSDFGTMSVGLFGQWGAANHTNIACSRSFGAFAFYIYHPVSARPSIRITTE